MFVCVSFIRAASAVDNLNVDHTFLCSSRQTVKTRIFTNKDAQFYVCTTYMNTLT